MISPMRNLIPCLPALFLLACGGSEGGSADANGTPPPDSSDPAVPDASDPAVPDASNPSAADAASGDPCGATGAATGAIDGTITIRGVERSYILAVPSDYDSNSHYALVFAFHGLGSNASQARLYFGVEEASAGEAIVIYPNGLPKYGSGTQTGWNLYPTGEDFELFDALLARITAAYCIDDARVFATGHSYGGYFSNCLGCGRGAALRAIAPVAGGGPYFPCDNGVAAWIAHGVLDSTVAISEGEASRDHWRDENGCDDTTSPTTPSPCVAYDGCDTGLPVVWCEHEETTLGGHGWPSFAPQGIWNFFDALD